MTEKNTFLGVYVSPGSAETLVRRGEITKQISAFIKRPSFFELPWFLFLTWFFLCLYFYVVFLMLLLSVCITACTFVRYMFITYKKH